MTAVNLELPDDSAPDWPFGAEIIAGAELPGKPGAAGVMLISKPIPDAIAESLGEYGERAREGIARLRVVAATGECPCGARLTVPTRQQRRARKREADKRRGLPRPMGMAIEHHPDCPGADPLFGIRALLTHQSADDEHDHCETQCVGFYVGPLDRALDYVKQLPGGAVIDYDGWPFGPKPAVVVAPG